MCVVWHAYHYSLLILQKMMSFAIAFGQNMQIFFQTHFEHGRNEWFG